MHTDYKVLEFMSDNSAESLQAKREWNDILQGLKGKKPCQPRIIYLGKLYFRNEG